MLNLKELLSIGIDTDEGMAYCADDPDFYSEMLAEYASEANGRLDDLQTSFTSHDWKRYGILAHSVKSTSRMIGAKDMSEHARVMEMAAKEGPEDTILSGHEQFIAAYRDLAKSIRGCIG